MPPFKSCARLLILALSFILIIFCFGSLAELAARTRGKPRLDMPALTAENSFLIVYSQLKDAFTTEIEKILASGKTVDFCFYMELCRPRFSFFYPDERIWRETHKHSVQYNPATREYTIVLETLANRETRFTENPEEMMSLVSQIRFQVPQVIKSEFFQEEYYVRMWLTADTKPLPGGFTTRTVNSRRFIPARLLDHDD
ncbi:DUF4390 domain-containing protein [bacterium]|nr:DUF4390 domain-containing protein [bacterium]